jgi:hypothetical protein
MKKIIFILLLAVSFVSCQKETVTTQETTTVNLTARVAIQAVPNSITQMGIWVQLQTQPTTLPQQLTANVKYELFNGVNQFVSTNTYKATLNANLTANNVYTGVVVPGNYTVKNIKINSIEFNNPNFVVKF